jgi:hypothetical protein
MVNGERYRDIIVQDCQRSEADYARDRRRVLWTFRLSFLLIPAVGWFALREHFKMMFVYLLKLNLFHRLHPNTTIGRLVEAYNLFLLLLFVLTLLVFLAVLRLYAYDLMQRNEVIRRLLRQRAESPAEPAAAPPITQDGR